MQKKGTTSSCSARTSHPNCNNLITEHVVLCPIDPLCFVVVNHPSLSFTPINTSAGLSTQNISHLIPASPDAGPYGSGNLAPKNPICFAKSGRLVVA